MRPIVRALVAVAMLSLGASSVFARCDPTTEPDRTDVANARAAVAASCDCAGAINHASYESCAAGVADQRVAAGSLRAECRGAVRKCAARSVCGRPGYVTCCRTTRSGTTRCATKRDASKCRAPTGGTACVGAFASCCDACTGGGCATTSTTTTSTTSTTTTSTTTTIPFPFVPCTGGSGAPTCDGTCDTGLECRVYQDLSQPQGICACFPVGRTPCDGSLFPQCGGACPDGKACGAFQAFDPATGFLSICACVDPAKPCVSDASGMCVTVGYCPPGSACIYTPIAPHANCPCCGCGTPVGG